MNARKLSMLSDELRLAGAKPKEINQLLPLARNLGALQAALKASPSTVSLWKSKWMPLGSMVLVVMLLVILSQASLPGSMFYPVKRSAEWVAVNVQPSYRGTIMMRRAQEVQALVNNHASSSLVLRTLADYQTDAISYKSTGNNYSLLEYCKNSLHQAQARATTPERQAINQTLTTLQDS